MPDAADTTATIAVDTSVAVPHLLNSHAEHDMVRAALAQHRPCLTSHSLAETYSVLTRLPGDARLEPAGARDLIQSNFPVVAELPSATAQQLHTILSVHLISGGAVYDALVALAAVHADLPLATRDARAVPTYAKLGAAVRVIAG